MADIAGPSRRSLGRADRAAVAAAVGQRAVRQRRRGRDAARAGDSVHRAEPGLQLSRPARQPGELPRQRAAADAAVPARGTRRGDRSRLRQGDRPADGGGGAFQCRADARHDGDVQRLVRPHAGAAARRDRSGGRAEAPALDRLDPHRARPGRADPRLYQVGRSAGLGRGGARSRCCVPTGWRVRRRWGRCISISTPACRRRRSPIRCRRSMRRDSCRRSRPRLRRSRWRRRWRCCARRSSR